MVSNASSSHRVPGPDRGQESTASLRVLLLAHLDRLANRLDRSQYYRYIALAEHPEVALFGPGVEGYRPGMTVAEASEIAFSGAAPDVILHGMDFKESGTPLVSGLAKADALTVLELQDSWAVPEQQIAFINREQFDLALLIVRHHTQFYRENCPCTEFLWTPHAINTGLFRDHGLPKDYDVLLYGNIFPHTYPFRARLADVLSRSGMNFRHIAHPGYYQHDLPQTTELIAGKALSREINRAWITISTSGIFRCVMMKYFEIAASYSCIAGDMPEEGRELFGSHFIELSPEQSDREILDTLRYFLTDKPRLSVISAAAYRRVHSDFSTQAFAHCLLEQLRTHARLRKCTGLLRGGPRQIATQPAHADTM